MGNQQFANNASSILAANVNNSSNPVVVQVSAGDGNALFPALAGSQFFIIAVESNAGAVEFLKCTSRSGDNLTCSRAQEGSVATAFTANLARVEIRPTAGTDGGFVQKTGDTMSGDLNMGTHNLTNAVLGSGSSVEAATEIVNTPLRGATGISTNQILVPTNGTSRATASGLPILCVGDPLPAFTIGQILMWYGALVNIPTLWHACDGTTPTNSQGNPIAVPDLRDKFVVGAGGTLSPALGGAGGNTSYTVPGSATVADVTGSHVLTVAEMPAHHHDYFGAASPSNVANGSGKGWDFGVGQAYRTNTPATAVNGNTQFIKDAGADGGHTHTVPALATSSVSLTNVVPPFYGLYLIMYIG
jgi:microcystin-dependent protein